MVSEVTVVVTHVLDGRAGLHAVVAAGWRLNEWPREEVVSSGFSAIDRLLPAGGMRRGGLVEWLASADAAGGALTIACAVACRLADPRAVRQLGPAVVQPAVVQPAVVQAASTIVVVDRGPRFYPPAVLPWLDAFADGMGKSGGRPQLVVARPSRDDDELWAIDQALRCPGVAAVLAWPGRVHATAMRRWQLAARASGAVGLLVRGLASRPQAEDRGQSQAPAAVRREPTWADARLAVSSLATDKTAADLTVRRLRLSLVSGPWTEPANGAWSAGAMLEERSTEVCLDLANGREATRCHRASVLHAAAPQCLTALPFRTEDAACRAS